MEKRAVFRSAWLPYALLLPQLAVTILFFFWPAAQAVYWSTLVQDAFGRKVGTTVETSREPAALVLTSPEYQLA